MTRNLNPTRFAWLCLLLVAVPAAAQQSAQPAKLRIRLPADAGLTVDGQQTKQTGPVRRFISPPLTPGKTYRYTLQWTYRQDGESVTRTRIVRIHAGEDKEVDLNKADDTSEPSPEKAVKRPTDKNEETKGPTRKPDVEFVPTPQDVVDRMLQVAAISQFDVVYDLGCGDGRIVVTAAKKYRCKAVGFDIDPERVQEARANVKAAKVEKLVTIVHKDIFDVDLKPASVVMLYLLPELNVKLIPQLEKLPRGARIISHDFKIEGIEPQFTVPAPSKDGRKHTIYVWIAPIRKK